MKRPTGLPIRHQTLAASTIAMPSQSSPTPSRRCSGSRSRALCPNRRAVKPAPPATTIHAAASACPIHWTRIRMGSRGLGRAGGRRPWPARRLLPLRGLPLVDELRPARRGRSGSRTGLAGASRGAGFALGRPVRLRADILGAAAARAVVALGRTGGHDDQANEHPVPAEGPARACRPIPGQPRWPLPAGGTPMASLAAEAAEKASIKPPASDGSPLRGDPGSQRAAILILWISLGGGARWMAGWSRAARR